MADEPPRYVCLCLCVHGEGSLKENGNKTKHRWDLTESSFSAHYSELALKASSAQKLSMLLPLPCVCAHTCVYVCAVITVPFIAHLATLLFHHCLAPLTSQRDNIRAFYRIIPLLKRKLFSCGAHWPSISHIHYIYILVMWQMLPTKRSILYGVHILQEGRYQHNKKTGKELKGDMTKIIAATENWDSRGLQQGCN